MNDHSMRIFSEKKFLTNENEMLYFSEKKSAILLSDKRKQLSSIQKVRAKNVLCVKGIETVPRHDFWRQFPDRFEDSSPTFFEDSSPTLLFSQMTCDW